MKKQSKSFKINCFLLTVLFFVSITGQAGLAPTGLAYAEVQAPREYSGFPSGTSLNLPAPNQFVPLSKTYSYPVLQGLKIDPDDPFKFEFIIDTKGKNDVSDKEVKALTEYFLAVVTTPSKDLWVNLSPYEKDRIISDNLSDTELGKGLLSQDYILKQLLASVTHPESKTGKDYWNRAYKEIAKIAKTSNIPIDTFNKIWITPKTAKVIENNNIAFITESSLKAMLQEDYMLQAGEKRTAEQEKIINKTASNAMKQTILPEIEKDINYGENFAKLRQIYNSFILGVWFKKKLKDSIFQHYINQNKTKGIDLEDKTIKDKVYNLYIEAFQKGLYDYVKKENTPPAPFGLRRGPSEQKLRRRRYFSGGIGLIEGAVEVEKADPTASSGIILYLGGGSLSGSGLTTRAVKVEPAERIRTPAKADKPVDKEFSFKEKNILGHISDYCFYCNNNNHDYEESLEFTHDLRPPQAPKTLYLVNYGFDLNDKMFYFTPYLKVSVETGELKVESLQEFLRERGGSAPNTYLLDQQNILITFDSQKQSIVFRIYQNVGASNTGPGRKLFILKPDSASSSIAKNIDGGINFKEAEGLVEVKGQGVYYNIPSSIAGQFNGLDGLKVTAVKPGEDLKSMLGLEN